MRASAVLLALLAGGLCQSCSGEDKPVAPTTPAPVAAPAVAPVTTPVAAPVTAPITVPAQPKPAKPAAAPAAGKLQPAKPAAKVAAKPRISSRIDVELTGVTSETTDQVYSRLYYTRKEGPVQWFVRAGYGATLTRTYTKNRTNTTELDTTTIDAQYRRDRKKTYNFITAGAYIRNRTPYSPTYGDLSGYYMFSAGVGRKLVPGLEGEFALANVHRYEPGAGTNLQPAYTLRLKAPLTSVLTLDGESNFLEPFTDDVIVDSRLNLTYKFTPALSMRLTYIANNMLPGATTKSSEWDKTFRVSLVFSRAAP